MDSDFLQFEDPDKRKSRLYWRCRRGMLELDYLLQNFLQKNYSKLTPIELESFGNLLQTPDALLLEYLMGRTIPLDPGINHVVQKIRNAA